MDDKQISLIVQPYLEKCRPGDWKHALRVVKWVKLLGDDREDLDTIVLAAYIHDIGWFKLTKRFKLDFDDMLEIEAKANEQTETLVTQVLTECNLVSKLPDVLRLVAAADKHEANADDEAVIVDSDTLSKLCVAHITEKYEPKSYARLLQKIEDNLEHRITTVKGKELFPELLKTVKNQLNL